MKNNNPPALGQKENAKHGEVFFPVQKYITRLAADYPVITTHWHDEAELTLITKGSCTYQIDLLEYEAKDLYPATAAAFHFNKGLRRILLGNVCIPYQFFRWKQYRYMLFKISDSANQP